MDSAPQRATSLRSPFVTSALSAMKELVHDMRWSQRFYLAFLVLGCAYIALIKVLPEDWSKALLVAVVLAGASAALIDAYRLFSLIWGKLLLAAIYALTTNTALGVAGIVVNGIIGTDIVELPLTRNVMAILLVPSLALVATIFLTFGGIFVASLYVLLNMALQVFGRRKDIAFIEHTLPFPTYLARLFVMICFLGAVPQISEMINAQEERLEEAGSFFAYHFEALRHTRCALADNQAAVKGTDGEYLIITKVDDAYAFEERACVAPAK